LSLNSTERINGSDSSIQKIPDGLEILRLTEAILGSELLLEFESSTFEHDENSRNKPDKITRKQDFKNSLFITDILFIYLMNTT
jgi:hypothetical protein